MKTIAPILFGLLIFVGMLATATPFIANWLFPADAIQSRTASEAETVRALKYWFAAPQANVRNTQALHQIRGGKRYAWFYFEVERDVVEQFVIQNALEQKPLDEHVLETIFFIKQNPIDWWQPQKLKRETWFMGVSEGRHLALIYNADEKSGFLTIQEP